MKMITADHSGNSWKFCQIDAITDPDGVKAFTESVKKMYSAEMRDWDLSDNELRGEIDALNADIKKFVRSGLKLEVGDYDSKISIERDLTPDNKHIISIKYNGGGGGYDHLLDFSAFDIVKMNCVDKTGDAYIDPGEVVSTCSIKKHGKEINVQDLL